MNLKKETYSLNNKTDILCIFGLWSLDWTATHAQAYTLDTIGNTIPGFTHKSQTITNQYDTNKAVNALGDLIILTSIHCLQVIHNRKRITNLLSLGLSEVILSLAMASSSGK